ncbi:hypothetical protein TNIN_62261 [Trichonephila inaurata madagascariensis]|uniref:Uncharacterized protein n=1 Tax=Trichonephila inaurata madagascariensis TaxID=2747483 RepID=A0A8X7CHV9_9ARAC|nr:hypothetical protein TNIN_62261 [Trichonephila inaurata madagascariensis]
MFPSAYNPRNGADEHVLENRFLTLQYLKSTQTDLLNHLKRRKCKVKDLSHHALAEISRWISKCESDRNFAHSNGIVISVIAAEHP